MEFNLTKKQVKRTGQWLMPPPEGKTICYEEPLNNKMLGIVLFWFIVYVLVLMLVGYL